MSEHTEHRPGDGRLDGRAGSRLRDAGHEAVGQALMISIGLAGMLAAARLAEASVAGMQTLIATLG